MAKENGMILLISHLSCTLGASMFPEIVVVFLGFFCLFVCLFSLFAISWAAPAAYGGSQARGLIGAVAAALHHSHSNAGSLTQGARPGIEPTTSWLLVRFVNY